MFGFYVVNLITAEPAFSIPSRFGSWTFERTHNYDELAEVIESKGMCGNTYTATIPFDMGQGSDEDFDALCGEFIAAGLILSWLTAKSVTASGTTPDSQVSFLSMGDDFLRPRGIAGFAQITTPQSLTQLFSPGLPQFQAAMGKRRLQLMMTHWMSGLTCFTVEDLFISACVQMDIVKHCEIQETGGKLSYFSGMESASRRYGLLPLNSDFKDMRNDLVHEGVLSGTNNGGKLKHDCSTTVAGTLNWIDEYLRAALGLTFPVTAPRWSGDRICHGLPSFSVAS